MERKLLDMMNQLSISEYNPRMKYCDKFQICRCKKVKTEYRGDDGMNKLYDLLKYIIYASFYVIVIKTGMDFYEYKRFPKLYESNSAPWYTEALLYCVASFAVIIVCFALRVIIKRKMKKG